MEEERVMCLGIFDQPLHSVQHVGLGRKLPRILVIVCQDHNVLWFEIPVLCEVGRMGGAAMYVGRIGHTHEELANVFSIVHTAFQFLSLPRVIDSDLKRKRHSSASSHAQDGSENFRRHVRTAPSSFPYTSSSGISVGHCGRASVSGQEAVLGAVS